MNFNITEIKSFVTENVTEDILKKIGITAGIFFVVIVSQLLIHEVVAVIDAIPVFNGFLQLVGLIALIQFTRNNLMTQDQRDALKEKVETIYSEVVSDEEWTYNLPWPMLGEVLYS